MEKKILSGAIVSALAMSVAMPADAAKKNVKPGLDNPLEDPACSYDEFDFTASWHDPNEASESDTKYGGEIEFDTTLFASCDFTGTAAEGTEAAEKASFSYSESAIVDIDLSRDESDPFFYTCDEGAEEGSLDCMASVSWEDVQSAADSAAEGRYGDLEQECSANVEVCTSGEWVCNDVYGYFANNCVEMRACASEETQPFANPIRLRKHTRQCSRALKDLKELYWAHPRNGNALKLHQRTCPVISWSRLPLTKTVVTSASRK